MYEGLSSLCFCCGCLGHKVESYPYSIKENEKVREEIVEDQNQGNQEGSQSNPNYKPWMLVMRKRNPVRNGRAKYPMKSNGGKVVSPRGNFVHSGAKWSDLDEDTSYGSLKEDSHITKDPPSRESLSQDHQMSARPEGDGEGTLAPHHENSKSGVRSDRVQGDGTIGKAIGVPKSKNSKSLGVKGSKPLKRHYPSLSRNPSLAKI